MARDPFVEEYQRSMAAVRKSRPKKRARLDMGAGTKTGESFTDQMRVERQYPAREFNPQTQGTGRATTGYDPLTSRAARAVGEALGNPGLAENWRALDENLLGLASAENAAFNLGRGEGGWWDVADIILSAPFAAAATKPFEIAGRGLARKAGPLAARLAGTRAGRYLTESRPLADAADDVVKTAFRVQPMAQRRITNKRPVVRGLPAPEKRLGLPAPGPGLPDWAAKPRGGQWRAVVGRE